MIQRKKQNWFRMLFIWEGSVLPKILPRLLIILILSIVVVVLKGVFFSYKVTLDPAPFTLFGIALALFLGFRNTASYDRFCEARKIWGSLLNDSRSLARQALTISGYSQDSEETGIFINYLTAFIYALKHQLRGTDATADLFKRLNPELAGHLSKARYKPALLLKEMGQWVQKAREMGHLDTILQVAFEQNIDKLSEVVGGCERIASTPIPYTYRVLLHRTVYLYCFLLPFGFVDSLSWMTPLIVVFITYTFIALEAIADEIEEPFGTEPNDLALNSLSAMIEATVLEMAGKGVEEKLTSENNIID